MRRILFMALAILAAGGTFALMQSGKEKNTAAQVEQKQGPYVLVASKTLTAGSFVNAENLKWQAFPDESLSLSYLTKENTKIEDLSGSVVRRVITVGEPITAERLIKPGDRGFVAAILKEGMRAVSVSINASSGIAGLVFPGDQVDVLLTHSVRSEDENRPMRQVSETILTNVRVLALDQRTDDQNPKPTVPKTTTLEVTPKQAEILMVARELGRLSLSLRSLSDSNEAPDAKQISEIGKTTYTLDGEASMLLSKELTPKKVSVVRGSETEEVNMDGSSSASGTSEEIAPASSDDSVEGEE